MDSINKNQTEENRKDLHSEEAVRKIQEIVKQAQNCFFCTSISVGQSDGARPMNVRHVDDEGNLWFLSASDSHKNQELAREPLVRLYFQGSTHSDFLQLNGRATILRDREKIKSLWDPFSGHGSPKVSTIRASRSLRSHLSKVTIGTPSTDNLWPVSKCWWARPSAKP